MKSTVSRFVSACTLIVQKDFAISYSQFGEIYPSCNLFIISS